MKPELRPITRLTLASTTALFLLAAPLAVDWRTLDIDTIHAEAKGDKDGKGSGGGLGGGLGGAVGNAAGAVGDAAGAAAGAVGDAAGAVGDAAEGAADAAGDAADGAAGAAGDAADGAAGDAADGAAGAAGDAAGAVGDAAEGAAGAVGDAADSVADGATDVGGSDVGDGSAPSDDAASDGTVAESGEPAATEDADDAPDAIDTATDTVDTATGVVDEADEVASETVPEASIDDSTGVPAGATGRVALRSARVTVSVTTIRRKPEHGDRGDKHRLVGARSVATTVTAELPPDDATARGLAAIEPSAGPVLPAAPQPQASASASCAADDGHQQGTEISCLVAGSDDDLRTRQVAYAPSAGANDGQASDVTTNRQIAPSIEKSPDGGPTFYDELYGLQQVEARRYADGDVPVLIVQGIVSNMSNGQRSVPPLLAIVQDDQGKELMRWTFRAEAEALGPGGSTGFRSEMFDPQSESAKVTIVFAAEQQTTMQ